MSIEERYRFAREGVESISYMSKVMGDMGIFGEEEYKASAILITTLHRAMLLIDPEETKKFDDEVKNAYLAKMDSPKVPNYVNGQYL